MPAYAESIVPAIDITKTQITQSNEEIRIFGGQLSTNGTNLFHSFTQFGLSQGQIANFLSNPTIQNILARVVGGNPSIIDGLIRVTGGHSNLYLINPAGIVFGPNANLNVPAAFTATTANRLGFRCGGGGTECHGWFNTVGTNDYGSLDGAPNGFAFTSLQPGIILNAGNLTLSPGQNLTLLGGTVINTGTLTAPGGTITIAAVPGENLVRLSQQGTLLSLEFSPLPPSAVDPLPISPLTLPQLLTGGTLASATKLAVNPDGTVQLSGSGTTGLSDPGTAILSGSASLLASGVISVASSPAFTTAASPSSLTPQINILGTKVGLFSATLDASAPGTGGTIRIGGDYQGQGSMPRAQFTQVDAQTTIRADGLSAVDSTNSQGAANGGRVIVWADQTTRVHGRISANGGDWGGNGGLIETSGKEFLDVGGASIRANAKQGKPGTWLLDPRDIVIFEFQTSGGSIDLPILPPAIAAMNATVLNASEITAALNSGMDVTIKTDQPGSQAGNIWVASPLLPTVDGDATLTLQAANNITVDAPIQARIASGPLGVVLSAGGQITTNAEIGTQGGTVSLTAGGNIAVNQPITTTDFLGLAAGNLAIASGGEITTGPLIASQVGTQLGGSGGDVTLNANGLIRAATIDTRAFEVGSGGDVAIRTTNRVQVTGTFRDGGTNLAGSIVTTGPNGNGQVLIEHGGGSQNIPFVLGDPTVNGTAGAIVTGSQPFVDILSPPRTIPGNFTSPSGKIKIRTQGNPSSLDDLLKDFLDDHFEDDHFGDDELETSVASNIADLDTPPITEPDFEAELTTEFDTYLDTHDKRLPKTASATLQQIQQLTGTKSALIYLQFIPATVATQTETAMLTKATMVLQEPDKLSAAPVTTPAKKWVHREDDPLELILVTNDGRSIRKLVAGATRGQVLALVRRFLNEVTDARKTRTQTYLAPAQQLYRWLIAPIAAELQGRQVTNLAFIADSGLRFIPLAALHDGQQFLVEKYSLGLMPSLTLTDTDYVNLQNARILAMGASEFAAQPSLPAVPTELSVITQQLRQGRSFLNQDFTLDNLKNQRSQEPFPIIHLATHGEFQPGTLNNSYIQLWDTKLRMDQIRQLGWNNPPVELLVLSACRTALGNDQAELGFAGFAVQAGVKSALASLWYVSDEGTLGLMSSFYHQLQSSPIKAEALRQAQVAMLKGQIQVKNGKLISPNGEIPLPSSSTQIQNQNLAHPYYWSAFTLIGSPW